MVGLIGLKQKLSKIGKLKICQAWRQAWCQLRRLYAGDVSKTSNALTISAASTTAIWRAIDVVSNI